ncbi:MAG: hypothetical protein BRD55_00495 [Bacteroidetes bacterium SW_9_63_38]|nr:MAG: hypothetical protein BRD55_00495 [Bacteroidetes bacterium SW_9_63_38]
MADTKRKIMEVLDVLPEARRREVLDYVKSLREEEEQRTEDGRRDPAENPLLDYIGGVEHGSLAQDIDEELYREEV